MPLLADPVDSLSVEAKDLKTIDWKAENVPFGRF
jgi:hypothetical protein